MARKKANKKGADPLQRALNALDAILPKPSLSTRDLCQNIVGWIRQGTPNAANLLRDAIHRGNVHPSAVADDGMGHLIWAAAFALMQCRGEAQTDAFLSILSLLVDDLDVSVDQRSPQQPGCCRNPLQFVAKANNPLAVRAMVERGANVDLRDEEGWTALGSVFMADECQEGVETTAEECRDRIETARILLDAGADVEAVSTTGFTPLLISCLNPDVAAIELLVSYGANRKHRTLDGSTPVTILESVCEKNQKLLKDCRKALLVDDHDNTVTEDIKAIRFSRFMNRVILPANNDCVNTASYLHLICSNGISEEEKAQGFKDRAKQEVAVLGALMTHVGMDANLLQKQITSKDGNWLESLYNKVEAIVPKAFLKTYCDVQPTEQELSLMISQSKEVYKASHVENSIGVRSFDREAALNEALSPHRERGLIFAPYMDSFIQTVIDPIQHSVGFAVPTHSLLERIQSYGPVVEVGAGTGYWTAVLRGRGVDALAYDAHLPSKDTMSNQFFSFVYTNVRKGDATLLFDGEAGEELARRRTLLMVWPNLNDSEDNPHLSTGFSEAPVWDADCLLGYVRAGGKTVVYVGEREENISVTSGSKSESGVSSSRRFQNMLKEYFDLAEQHDCPCWFKCMDDATIWTRK